MESAMSGIRWTMGVVDFFVTLLSLPARRGHKGDGRAKRA
jgi:hypothetical protein